MRERSAEDSEVSAQSVTYSIGEAKAGSAISLALVIGDFTIEDRVVMEPTRSAAASKAFLQQYQ